MVPVKGGQGTQIRSGQSAPANEFLILFEGRFSYADMTGGQIDSGDLAAPTEHLLRSHLKNVIESNPCVEASFQILDPPEADCLVVTHRQKSTRWEIPLRGETWRRLGLRPKSYF